MKQPKAEKRPHVMTLHGHTRVDEYFWLRDDARQDPEVIAYLEAENAWFDSIMEVRLSSMVLFHPSKVILSNGPSPHLRPLPPAT